ncbi:nucleotidyltransferase domain-containing protein [Dyadobacter sp. 22481]|uniref:nucleotidyltransferase domain-containing protein n=1 Tax=Dyadobacter sp. 22481 TaxID=3453926 RepID=UPI003F87069E
MADLQKYFEKFNASIRLGRFNEEKTLIEKRDIIRTKLNDRLPGIFEKYGEKCPKYYFRDQGSYELGTGIKPLNGDFDIDQGLYFEISKDDYVDPVVLKSRVYEALSGHTKEVRVRRPCVTVFYQQNSEKIYHVDIAIYSAGSQNASGLDYLAIGRENSDSSQRLWIESNPRLLADLLERKFAQTNERHQFRRIIRYLKRWKDFNFASEGYQAPRGIALTVAAYNWFQPHCSDPISQKYNDLEALKSLVESMLANFQYDYTSAAERLKVHLPVAPGNDLFEKMTTKQMKAFGECLMAFSEALLAAKNDVDPVTACEKLSKKVFGNDFPVPEKSQTAQRSGSAGIIGTHESA